MADSTTIAAGANNGNDIRMAVVPMDGAPRPTRMPPKRMLSDIPEPKTRSGLGGVVSNLVNSIVGAGIIGEIIVKLLRGKVPYGACGRAPPIMQRSSN